MKFDTIELLLQEEDQQCVKERTQIRLITRLLEREKDKKYTEHSYLITDLDKADVLNRYLRWIKCLDTHSHSIK